MPRTITLVVPEGIEPGDSLCFNVGGQDVELPLPAGSKPGDALQIQVADESEEADGGDVGGCEPDGNGDKNDDQPNPENDNNSNGQKVRIDDDGTCYVSLHPSTEKELTFQASDSAAGAAICSELWPTGLRMANIITNTAISEQLLSSIGGQNKSEKKTRVLEVGSGLGTVGLALATTLDNAEVVLTDCPPAIKMLEANIDTNKDLMGSNVNVKAHALEWGKYEQETKGSFDIICGSDLLYGEESSYQPLVDTLSALMRREAELNGNICDNSGLVLLGVRWRKPEKEKKFFGLAQHAGIHFTLLNDWLKEQSQQSKDEISESFIGMSSLSWKQYGDIDDVDFMHHLTSAVVSTGGGKRKVNLAEMSEKDMEDMTDDEHAAFERTQIQIYVGQWAKEDKKRAAEDVVLDDKGAEKKAKLVHVDRSRG